MKYLIKELNLLSILLLSVVVLNGQEVLTIELCQHLARQNYPLLKQLDLTEQTTALNLEKTNKMYLPAINIGMQATYQSDVTSIPFSIPNLPIDKINKDQYKIYGEIVQPVTDLITVNRNYDLIKANSETEKQKTEIELYEIQEQINSLFFNVLLLEIQTAQTHLVKKDIEAGIEKTKAAIVNGVSQISNLELLEVELLKLKQKHIEIVNTKYGLIKTLSIYIGKDLDENTILVKPKTPELIQEINRPELIYFSLQNSTFDVQDRLLSAKNIPKLNLFLQTGYGRPSLNMLDNNFDFYYIGGIKMTWSISNYYTFNKEKKIIDKSRQLIDIQKETFMFNTKVILTKQDNEIEKLNKLIEADNEIVKLRERIKHTAESQLESGIITPIDFMNIVNSLDQSRNDMALHEIKLLMACWNYNNISGN